MVLLLAGVIISLSGESFAREVEVNSSQVTLDYGVREYNEVFYDTLQFTAKEETETRLLSLDEVEVTCDCIEASILHRQQSGQSASFLAFTFHVDPEEPSGPGEKILYLYTKDNVYDLIRLVLRYSIGDSAGTNDSNQNRVEEQRPESGNTNAPLPALVDEARKHQPVLLYFGSSTCQSCRRVEEVVLPRLRERFGDELYLLKINIQQPDGFQYLLQVREQYGVTDKRSPFAFFIGKEAITGRSNLMSRLEIAVEKAVTDRSVTILPVPALETNRKAREVFRSISFWALVSAGLIDGINPCAFATLIFFISLLSYAKSTKKQVVLVGTGFTISVFAVYFLLGLGAFRALQAAAAFGMISKVIYGLTFLFLLVLLILSARDTIHYYFMGRKTDTQVLQLSLKNKKRIHSVMRKGLKTTNLMLGAVGIGALVSLFEAACTGQVYLPTIVLMMKDPDLKTNALLYLFIYNLLFILPLLIVFALTFAGVASEKFTDWSKRHFGFTRIALTLLFLVLAVLMGMEWFQI